MQVVDDIQYHPIANIFPLMQGAEFKEFVADIEEHGLLVPIFLDGSGRIIDGRNRYRALVELGMEDDLSYYAEYDGDDNSIIDFVMSMNLKRRQLDKTQSAVAAYKALPFYEAQARERQAHGETAPGKTLRAKLPQASGKAREFAAKAFGVSPRYVSDVKAIDKVAPELVQEMEAGTKTLAAAKRDIKKRQRKKRKESMMDTIDKENKKIMTFGKDTDYVVETGQWWQLGEHLLFCGDTSGAEFYESIDGASFAFADPPYNAGAADWDNDFAWEHDWLQKKANIVAVTPGIISIFEFAKVTSMTYRWSVAAWISNGMTRGALGFGNWIYTAIFSNGESIYRNSQDFLKVSISIGETERTSHKGRKPSAYMDEIIELFTDNGDLVIDPFAGSGSTLFSCQRMGRKCITGDISPKFCKDIICQWEIITGGNAVQL